MRSTRGLLVSKPHNQPDYPLSITSSKTNCMDREGSFAAWIKNHGNYTSLYNTPNLLQKILVLLSIL